MCGAVPLSVPLYGDPPANKLQVFPTFPNHTRSLQQKLVWGTQSSPTNESRAQWGAAAEQGIGAMLEARRDDLSRRCAGLLQCGPLPRGRLTLACLQGLAVSAAAPGS